MNTRTLARGLGWFSIGLGLAEVAALGQPGLLPSTEDETALLPYRLSSDFGA